MTIYSEKIWDLATKTDKQKKTCDNGHSLIQGRICGEWQSEGDLVQ